MSELVKVPDTKVVERKGLEAVERARLLVVSDNPGYLAAAEWVKGLKGLEREVKETFAEPKDLSHKAWKAVVIAETKHLEPIQEATRIANGKIAAFLEEQERLRRAEERRLQDEARKREEQERLDQAVEAEASGDREGAEELLSAPVQVPTVVLPKSVPKVHGSSMSYRYSAKVVDVLVLARFVIANPAFRNLIEANGPALNSQAIAQKDSFKIPGVELVKTPVMSYRGA